MGFDEKDIEQWVDEHRIVPTALIIITLRFNQGINASAKNC